MGYFPSKIKTLKPLLSYDQPDDNKNYSGPT